MTMHKNASDILKSLHGFIVGPEEDVTSLTPDQVQQYLKSEGIDSTPLVGDVKQRIAKLMAGQELANARERRLGLVSKTQHASVSESQPSLKDKIRVMIERLTQGNPELATVYFRKFEESSEADLETLLEDLTLLEELDDEDVA
ncbi:MAG: hypothetical protein FIA91_11905 [Geobacter sp.]|nr:hypothetical protein [Geobacter sp.]